MALTAQDRHTGSPTFCKSIKSKTIAQTPPSSAVLRATCSVLRAACPIHGALRFSLAWFGFVRRLSQSAGSRLHLSNISIATRIASNEAKISSKCENDVRTESGPSPSAPSARPNWVNLYESGRSTAKVA